MLAVPTSAVADFGRQPVPENKLTAELQDQFGSKNTLNFWVRLSARADTSQAAHIKDWTDRGQAVVDGLKATASSSQVEARKVLDSVGATYTPYWVTNAILVENGSQALATSLASLASVAQLDAQHTFHLPKPVDVKPDGMGPNAVEWGIANINADDVWTQFGVRGEGIVVANIDSGVDGDHPALVGKYRGNLGNGQFDHNYNWLDTNGRCPDAPCDGDIGPGGVSHGSHTMGTMVGDDGQGNQIGVAPGATWIAANGCDTCADADLIESGQWMLEPRDLAGQNPDVSKRPNIVNNSWGTLVPSTAPFMEDIQQSWADSGIFGVWSNGNNGSACATSGSPGSRTINYSVGAYNEANAIASFSSRGAGQDGTIKPNISAPGVAVRSSQNGGVYGLVSGTSMAAPHVSGAIALLWSAAPALIGDIVGTQALLDNTARDRSDLTCGGTEDDNNVWGEGQLDALALVQAAPVGDAGTLSGTVTEAANGNPRGGATVSITGPMTRQITTGPDGTYSTTLTAGTYQVSVQAFGFEPQTRPVTITAGQTTTADFALAVASNFPVSGTVTDRNGGAPIAGARVTIGATAIPPATTDAEGRYTFPSVPVGNYQVTATADRCVQSATLPLSVTGPTTLNFSVGRVSDAFGYFCQTEPTNYVEADTPVALTGDDNATSIQLPFNVNLYGHSYRTAFVSTNGNINFTALNTTLSNVALPNTAAPNAAIYALWDDLNVVADASVRTKTLGTAPNRQFVIEWRNVQFFATQLRVDFEVSLFENGDIVLAYRNIDAANVRETGSSATVGIENETGTVARQWSFNETNALNNATQIRYSLPPNGFVTGSVTDANDGLAAAGKVRAIAQDGTTVRESTVDADGRYSLQLFLGGYTIEASGPGYVAQTRDVIIDTNRESNTVDFSLATGIAEVDTASVERIIPNGQSRTVNVNITNTGSADLTFDNGEIARTAAPQVATPHRTDSMGRDLVDPYAKNSKALFTPEEWTGATPQATGDILASWDSGIPGVWGLGADENVWVSDIPSADTNTEFSPTGAATGRSHAVPWSGGPGWPGDMAFDPTSESMCQINVNAETPNIHCWDLDSGEDTYVIDVGFPTTQRGLGYNEIDDVFYASAWIDGPVYTVAGRTHTDPGAILSQCTPDDPTISGLAYNSTADVLWSVTNSPTDTIYQLNPEDCSTISTMGFPNNTPGAGAGIELDAAGNMWVVNQNDAKVYLLESGVPRVGDVPWLSTNPSTGTLAPGESATIRVTLNTAGLAAGVHEATLLLQTNAARTPNVSVPIKLVVPAYQVAVNAGGGQYVDGLSDTWQADKKWTAGTWGWIAQRTVTSTTTRTIGGTDDVTPFQSRRSGIFRYQFDFVPRGTYVVDLNFAEYAANFRPGARIFDVRIDGQFVLVAHDVAAEVRGLWADQHSFVIEHPGGHLNIEFLDRFGSQLPIVNSLRVTDRPDL